MSIVKKRPREGMIENATIGGKIANVLNTIILCVIIFASVVPLWHTVMSSFSDGKALMSHEGLVLWPLGDGFNIEGYKLTFRNDSIIRGYFNTIIYVAGNVILGFVINVIGGYVLSRNTKLKTFFRLFVIFSIMFSGGTVPLYMVVRSLGLTGTMWSLIIPSCTNAMFMIMVMNSFLSVPEATVEAAKIDGAGHIRLMFQVMLPQAMGLAIVTMINTGIMAWNAWFEASIYISTKKELWPLQLWIKELTANNQDFLNYSNPDYNRYLIQFVVIVVSTLPVLIVFPFFQGKLEKGMVMGAVKE